MIALIGARALAMLHAPVDGTLYAGAAPSATR